LSWDERHAEAIAHLRRAVELDPLNLQYNCNLGQVLGNSKQYDASIEQLKKTLDMDPNYAQAHAQLAAEYRNTGRYDQWIQEWKKAILLFGVPDDVAIAEETSRVYAQSGYIPAMRRQLELKKQLAKRRYVDPTDIADLCAVLGDKDQTFAWLDKAAAEKSAGMEALKVQRPLDEWHSDPRYLELLKRMGMRSG
jgi:tetratricopeptide (TPR) repeat protein